MVGLGLFPKLFIKQKFYKILILIIINENFYKIKTKNVIFRKL